MLWPLLSADEAQLGQGARTASFLRLAGSSAITNPTSPASLCFCAETLSVNKLPSTRIADRLNQPAAGLTPLVPALGLLSRAVPVSRPRGPQGTRCPLAWWLVACLFSSFSSVPICTCP